MASSGQAGSETGTHAAWRCPHSPECEERFDTLDALNQHVDSTVHACCQARPQLTDSGDEGAHHGR